MVELTGTCVSSITCNDRKNRAGNMNGRADPALYCVRGLTYGVCFIEMNVNGVRGYQYTYSHRPAVVTSNLKVFSLNDTDPLSLILFRGDLKSVYTK